MRWHRFMMIVLCAALLGGLSLMNRRDEEIVEVRAATSQAGYRMDNATVVETGRDGQPRLRMQVAHINEDVKDRDIDLQDVRVEYTGDSQTPWVLTAQRGVMDPSTRIVTLRESVEIRPQNPRLLYPVVLRCDELRVDAEQGLAHAPGVVTITMNQQLLTAVGLDADLRRQTLRLQSQVHGEFASRSL